MGVTYDIEHQCFVFDFEHDGQTDIVTLVGDVYRQGCAQKQDASVYHDFLKFRNEADKELCQAIRKQNILVVDDVTTSGSTLNEVLRTLRILNEDNNITVFSLIGRKDLMAES